MKGKRIISWMLICWMLLLVWPAADASAAGPKLRGLSIGYGDDDIVGDGLEGTYYNNADLAADLFTQAGFDRVEKLTAPTADELLLALEDVLGGSGASDRNYIYISVPCDTLNGRDSVLVLPDGTGYGTDVLLAEDFYRALMDLPGRFTVILDCNYAGGFLPTPLAVPGENSISVVDGNETAAESPEEKITVLYSTASDEVMAVAEDADGSRGAFSAHLAQAYLCGMLPKGNVAVKEFYGYLQRESMGAAAGYWGNGAMAMWPMWKEGIPGGGSRLSYGEGSVTITWPGMENTDVAYEICLKEDYLAGVFVDQLPGSIVLQKGEGVITKDGLSIALSRRLPAGNYILRLRLGDGRHIQHQFVILPKASGEPELTCADGFAPGGGRQLEIALGFTAQKDGISPFVVSLWVENGKGERVKTLCSETPIPYRVNGKTGRLIPEGRYHWDGRSDDGTLLGGGEYTLVCSYRSANASDTLREPVALTVPTVQLTINGRLGKGEAGAEVLLNGASAGKTDASGRVTLNALCGTHTLAITPVEKETVYAKLISAKDGALQVDLYDHNCSLAQLSVLGGKELIDFNKDVTEYHAVVDGDTDRVTVTAKAAGEKAVVFGTGEITLNVPGKETEIPIMVLAEDGSSMVYTIRILRRALDEPAGEEGTKPETDKHKGDETKRPVVYEGIPIVVRPLGGVDIKGYGVFTPEGSDGWYLRLLRRFEHDVPYLKEAIHGVYRTWPVERKRWAPPGLSGDLYPDAMHRVRVIAALEDGTMSEGWVDFGYAPRIKSFEVKKMGEGIGVDYTVHGPALVTIEGYADGHWRVMRSLVQHQETGCDFLPSEVMVNGKTAKVTAVRIRTSAHLGPDRMELCTVP